MDSASYNEEKHKQLALRHIFFPDIYGFIAETVIVLVVLVLFNANEISNRLFQRDVETSNPFTFSTQLLDQLWINVQQVYLVQQALIFLLWAMVGALVYIFVFRILQMFFGVKHSLGKGLKLIRHQHYSGVLRWFSSLHDFFLKALIVLGGMVVFTFGSLIFFGAASQELRAGLVYTFPSNIQPFIICAISGLLSIRFIVIGVCLLSPRFRSWYSAG